MIHTLAHVQLITLVSIVKVCCYYWSFMEKTFASTKYYNILGMSLLFYLSRLAHFVFYIILLQPKY